MKPQIDYTLYLVTDSNLMRTDTVEQSVELAIKGGCSVVQIREKEKSSRDFYDTALKVKAVCDRYRVPFIVNDRVDIALAVGATGVHIGQTDLPARVIKKLIGENKILGVSVSNLLEAQQAAADGADYLGVGAMFATETKAGVKTVSMETLKEIRQNISLPLVVIGGIQDNNIPLFMDTGINGIAVVSALVAQPDITGAARKLKALFLQTKEA